MVPKSASDMFLRCARMSRQSLVQKVLVYACATDVLSFPFGNLPLSCSCLWLLSHHMLVMLVIVNVPRRVVGFMCGNFDTGLFKSCMHIQRFSSVEFVSSAKLVAVSVCSSCDFCGCSNR